MNTEADFHALCQWWYHDTRIHSSITIIMRRPAIQKLLTMGPDIIPLALKELEYGESLWIWALPQLTGIRAARGEETVSGARLAWLNWGKEQYGGISNCGAYIQP